MIYDIDFMKLSSLNSQNSVSEKCPKDSEIEYWQNTKTCRLDQQSNQDSNLKMYINIIWKLYWSSNLTQLISIGSMGTKLFLCNKNKLFWFETFQINLAFKPAYVWNQPRINKNCSRTCVTVQLQTSIRNISDFSQLVNFNGYTFTNGSALNSVRNVSRH